jgi:Nuclear pore complex assembly
MRSTPSLARGRPWTVCYSSIASGKVSAFNRVRWPKQETPSKTNFDAATKSFPPRSNQDLRKLFDTVVNASAPDHQKHAIIYYILKDCKPLADQGETFARKVYLPRKYKVLIIGLHHLDQGQAKQALELLTDPSLTPTFSDQILHTLLQNPKVDNSFATAYYLTVLPPLDHQKTLNAFFSFLCDTNIIHAYHFCQVRASSERRTLFEQLIFAAISSKAGQTVPRAETLIGLPFNDMETLWFEDFLLHGKGSSLIGAKDSVVMRRIATGRDYADLQSLQRFRGQKIDGINWGDIRTNFQQGNNS